jgi:hypothetical protein
LGAAQFFFGASSGANVDGGLVFTPSDNLGLSVNGNLYNKYTSAVLRDVSGWYHLVAVLDTDNATAVNRIRIYINGVEQTSYTTLNSGLPPLGFTPNYLNNANNHDLGKLAGYASNYFDGYMAEINFIDGQALTADDFGEIDSVTGEWSPKAYEGTYGTNGFYLEFKDGAALGDDTSGNTNDWTPTNLASTDQMLDTPTNNFATLNPLVLEDGSLSDGNLSCNVPGGSKFGSASTIGFTSGKVYCEIVAVDATNVFIGVMDSSGVNSAKEADSNVGSSGNGVLYRSSDGQTRTLTNGSSADASYGATYTDNDLIGIAVDIDALEIEFFKNNVSQGVASIPSSNEAYHFMLAGGTAAATNNFTANFGADSSFAGLETRQGNTDDNGIGDFYYAPPTGYLALCTDNLPEPAIVDSETQFNVVLDTGANIKTTAEALYDSSLVWIKDRANSNNHQLIDTVRGTGVLQSNTTAAETTYSAPSGNSVAWVWKAGGTAVSNTDGSITSQVSANVDAGFSIVSYTGSGAVGSVGVGLTNPELIIIKDRDASTDWYVQTNAIDGSEDYLILNSTASELAASSGYSLGSNVFNFGGAGSLSNLSGRDYIAYCFHSVEGFSKIGTYVGNGSTNGPFVYTGFRPAFVMVKPSSTTGAWILHDTSRNPYNVSNLELQANQTIAEYSTSALGAGDRFDILSNGFKNRSSNSGANQLNVTYIYMAFAEAPFKEALAR